MKAERTVIGILAHVDAGKTTLAESILYKTGVVRKIGRVDHQDAFLDTHALEKDRGITIFSKQAQFALGDRQITLLDTPGHVDFSAEMERTLQVLDYAILVISGADGVQGHVMTLWRLLGQYKIPVFLFINKMDQPGTDRTALMRELRQRLDGSCMDFDGTEPDVLSEDLASCDELLMEKYLDGEEITRADIRRVIRERKVFPCYFGSALKIQGVDEFLDALGKYTEENTYPDEFSARVFKIARDGRDRLTYLKVTGGKLAAKQVIHVKGRGTDQEEADRKADQVRLYSGASYQLMREAGPGTVCAVTGLDGTAAGEGLGALTGNVLPVLQPVLTYMLELPEGADVHQTFRRLGQLEEEIPELHLAWNERLAGIQVQVMGEVQIQILQELILERLGMKVGMGSGTIVYKETLKGPWEGCGHYEPLRHYAEVHLVLSPGERGSGITFESLVSTDELDLNWQRLIFTHVEEKQHIGTLTGSELTDVKITLVGGRAHLKHTEGGDFRQATYRAIRQALMKARRAEDCILLEPVYSFRLEVPMQMVGRAMSDIRAMNGNFEGPETEGETAVLTGSAPVARMRDYPVQVQSYSGGAGRLYLDLKGYEPCQDQEEVVGAAGYDPEADTENPAGSVFCSHGAGLYVSWYEADDYMHLESGMKRWKEAHGLSTQEEGPAHEEKESADPGDEEAPVRYRSVPADIQDDEELLAIFTRTYGNGTRQERTGWKKTRRFDPPVGTSRPRTVPVKDKVLLVDGYNIIYAWPELAELAKDNMDGARGALMDILANYQGFRQMSLILVFDAYKVSGGMGENITYHNIHVVYTQEAETADAYIEKTVHKLAKDCDVTVATSDAAEQVIIFGSGARRLSARDLQEEVLSTAEEIRSEYLHPSPGGKKYLSDRMPEGLRRMLERAEEENR